MNLLDAPIGVPQIYSDGEILRIGTRTSQDDYSTTFQRRDTSEIVLSISGNRDGNTEIKMVDDNYWTVTLDGQPVSRDELTEMYGRPGLTATFDFESRKITYKKIA